MTIDHQLPHGARVALVSDVHLGDGSAGDLFGRKDELFLECLARESRDADAWVINGDAVDSMQAGAMERIAWAHPRVCHALRVLSERTDVFYVLGNHENERELRDAFPRFRFVRGLLVGDDVCIAHGHQFDMHWADARPRGHGLARFHSTLETLFGQPIRQPFRDYVNWPNRVVHRLWFMWTESLRVYGELRERMGDPRAKEHWRRVDNFWARGQWGDLGCLFQTAERYLREHSPHKTLVLGHSHQPGVVRIPGTDKTYVNAGSWSLESATYVRLHAGDVRVFDAHTNAEIRDERYAMLLREGELPDMAGWFGRYYKGFFRYDHDAIVRDFPPVASVRDQST